MAGILQEQHPQRTLLFHQWKQMDWPLLVDGLNRLQVKVVPLHILIDAQGVVVAVNPRADAVRKFVGENPATGVRGSAKTVSFKAATGSALERADAAYLAGELNQAIAGYGKLADATPEQGIPRFRLGVALRRRFEQQGAAADFSAAVQAWKAALDRDPNQYIWRRRIQQFGPRLDKPYPFYDWVDLARKDIAARGEQAVKLAVEPRGAEISRPARALEQAPDALSPDPDGRILRDEGFIRVSSMVVNDTQGRPNGRVHVQLDPVAARQAHWNNEAEPLRMWLDLPSGWNSDQLLLEHAPPAHATSGETRTLEFELQWPAALKPGTHTLPAYLLYNVCEDVDGTCLYRRQDLTVQVVIPEARE